MGSEIAPEFIYDQGMYYPVVPDYYGFYGTGNEKLNEWDDHHNFFGLDGQDIRFSGLQTENLPYVYYPPNYGYPQSYNPYNPYIPGAVMDVDVNNLGAQQYFTNQSYPPPSSSPTYIPVVVPTNTDIIPYATPDPSFVGMVPSFTGSYDNVGPTFANTRTSGVRTPAPVKVATENPSLGFPKIVPAIVSDEPVVNMQQIKQSTIHGPVQAGGLPQTIENAHSAGLLQATSHFSRGRVLSAQNSSKANLAAKNNFINYGSPMSPSIEKLNQKFPALSFGTRFRSPNIPSELNRGPRVSRAKDQGSSITSKSYTSKLDGNSLYKDIIIDPSQYDGNDFHVDYPKAKFFVIKSYSEDDIHKSIKYNIWSSTPNGNKKLDGAYLDAQNQSGGEREKCPVFLFFSVNASGHFCGVAEMIGRVDFEQDMDFWQQDQWSGSFPIKWHIIKDVPNSSLRHIILENNEDRPVTHSRDTQEVACAAGVTILTIFKNSSLKESILDDFMYYEELEKRKHQAKVKLPRRNYGSTDLIPTFVPANVSGGRIIQPMPSNKLKPNSVPDLLLRDDSKQVRGDLPEANKKDHLGSLGRGLEVDTPQTIVASPQLLNQNKKLSVGEIEQPVSVDGTQPKSKIVKSDSVVAPSQGVIKLDNSKVILPQKPHGQQLPDAVLHSSTSSKKQLSTGGHHRNADEKKVNRTSVNSQKAHGKAYRPVQRNEVHPPSENDHSKRVVLLPPAAEKKVTSEKRKDLLASDAEVNISSLKDAKSSAKVTLKVKEGNPKGPATISPKSQVNAISEPSGDPLAKPTVRGSVAGLTNSSTSDTLTIGLVQINVKGLNEYSGTSTSNRFGVKE